MKRRPRVHLIDCHVYIFRAYFALPPMQAPDGTPVGAVYGFTNALRKYLADAEVTHAAATFDYAQTCFRNEIEPGYKADRGDPPEDLEPQFDLCVQAAQVLGLQTFACEGFEADDLIATLCDRLVGEGTDVVVVSSDKDLTQLVTEDGRVAFYDLARGTLFDADGVRERFGVDPVQIPDYLGLVGDAVDCLPGVPGVGPKTAAAALAAFRTIERIPASAEAWSGLGVRGAARAAQRIEEHRERALRTRELATLRRDVPGLRVRARELVVDPVDSVQEDAFFDRLGRSGPDRRGPGRRTSS